MNLLPTLCPPRCWIHISGRPRLSPSIYSPICAHCRRDREPETSHPLQSHQATDPTVHILTFSIFKDCTVVLLPDGPTMMRWQGPTSPVHSSHFTGSWVAIQHRGEQSLGRIYGIMYLLPTLCPPRCWIHISGRPCLPPSIYSVLTVAEIASPRHPTHCKAIRQQILQY